MFILNTSALGKAASSKGGWGSRVKGVEDSEQGAAQLSWPCLTPAPDGPRPLTKTTSLRRGHVWACLREHSCRSVCQQRAGRADISSSTRLILEARINMWEFFHKIKLHVCHTGDPWAFSGNFCLSYLRINMTTQLKKESVQFWFHPWKYHKVMSVMFSLYLIFVLPLWGQSFYCLKVKLQKAGELLWWELLKFLVLYCIRKCSVWERPIILKQLQSTLILEVCTEHL